MEPLKLFESLKNPKLYGSDVDSVDVLQTHISFVALTGKYAYKIKKPVNFGFLDFSTLEKRKRFCDEEIRLNRRLCPDIYLDVVPLTKKNDDVELNGDGQVVDYAVKMREFPQEQIMTKLLEQDKINESVIGNICDILVDFYNSGEQSKDIKQYGSIESVKKNTDENFEQTQSVVDVAIPRDVYDYLKNTTSMFYKKKKDVFDRRVKEGRIRDCHGDLHSGNIVVSDDDIYIFDCIEFNKRFRYIDVASDIGFLAMDLDFLNNPYLSSYLIERYVEKSKDKNIFDMLNFYKCYRAYVRGKVIGFKLSDPSVDEKEKQEIVETTQKYFDLAQYYATLFSMNIKKDTCPSLFLVCGLTGTGKSTVASKISVDHHAHLINTDVVRKEIAGIDKFERRHDAYNTGLYSPEKVDYTYGKVTEKAEGFLRADENVVLDATFQSKKHRDMAQKLAEKTQSCFLIINCTCPEEDVRRRLEERVKEKSVSDGRWEVYVKQKDSFEPFDHSENLIDIDTSNKSYDYRMNIFKEITKKISGGG